MRNRFNILLAFMCCFVLASITVKTQAESPIQLSIDFDEEMGTYSIFRNGDVPLVFNARLEIRLKDRVINCAGSDFENVVSEDSFTDKLGSGHELVVRFKPVGQTMPRL